MEKIGRIGHISGADRIKCQGINEFWRKRGTKNDDKSRLWISERMNIILWDRTDPGRVSAFDTLRRNSRYAAGLGSPKPRR